MIEFYIIDLNLQNEIKKLQVGTSALVKTVKYLALSTTMTM